MPAINSRADSRNALQTSDLRIRLAARVDGASVAVFRAAFGMVILYEVYELLRRGWVREFWVEPAVRFTYHGFGWVTPLPEPALWWLTVFMGVAAVALAVGFMYRIAAWSVFLIFSYLFLLEATRYLNHFYAACLFALLLCFVPAANSWSIDRSLGRVSGDGTVPAWSLWMLRFQVGVLYVYGGFAKLQGDWLAGEPVTTWMSRRMDDPFVSFLVDRAWDVPFFAWGGVTFDLLVVPALLWRRTRALAFVAALCFHLLNARLFHIGVFPWMMIGLTTIFLAPDWPRRLLRFLRLSRGPVAAASPAVAPQAIPRWALICIAAYVGFQCLWPARAHLYPGNVLWTEEAQTFSWRMMLREKQGQMSLRVETDAGVDTLSLDGLLRPWQVLPVASRPFLALQLARHVSDLYKARGHTTVRVYADAWMSLNGRRPQRLIDPTIDLSSQPQSLWPASWILPLEGERQDGRGQW